MKLAQELYCKVYRGHASADIIMTIVGLTAASKSKNFLIPTNRFIFIFCPGPPFQKPYCNGLLLGISIMSLGSAPVRVPKLSVFE